MSRNEEMSASKVFASMNPNAYTVGIKFGEARYHEHRVQFIANNDKVYTYATEYAFTVGELAIVESPYNGFTVVQIARVDEYLDISQFGKFRNLKWVIDGVHVEDYVKLRYKLNEFDALMQRAISAERQAKVQSTLDEFESKEAKSIINKMKALFK